MDLPQLKCPHCGSWNPDDAFFCGECGGQMQSLVSGDSGPIDLSSESDQHTGTHEPNAPYTPPEPDQPPMVTPQQEEEPKEKSRLSTTIPPKKSPWGEPTEPIASESPTPPEVKPPSPPETQPPPLKDPYTPGAGVTPPPPPPQGQGAYQPPQQGGYPPQGQGGYQQGSYQQQQPGYGPPGGYAQGYGYNLPPDGNTSGMGEHYPAPPHASGWTFAGCVPFGLFGLINGITMWGIIGLLGALIPYIGSIAAIVYLIYIGLNGRELAWRHRRFDSLIQYEETMNAWNTWGLILGIGLPIVGFVIGMILSIIMVAAEGTY